MSKRLLCVWLPNWPVQRVQAAQPQLASSPLVLSDHDSRRGLIVAAANLAARAEGIYPSMRLSEATALADTEVCEHDSHEDIDALCSLAEQAQQFSPIVGLEQLDKKLWAGRTLHQPECLVLDITGLASLFGGEETLLGKVGHWLATQNYFGCLGIADSLGAAWAIANYAMRGNRKSEPKKDVPDAESGVPESRYCIAPIGRDAETVGSLSIAALRLQTATVESLARLGIRSIGQLSQLPRDGMATRLGNDLISRWDQVFGTCDEPVVTMHSQPDWCLEQSLEYPTQHRETVTEIVRRLSLQLSERLNKRGEGAIRIVCRLDLVKSQPLIMQLGMFRPTNDAAHLQLLLTGQMEQQLGTCTTHEVWRVSLQATLTAAMVWRQADLFSGGESTSRREIARLVDTLSSRLGRKRVLSAKSKRESQPELAYSLQPMTGRRHDGSDQVTIKKLSSRMASKRAEPSRNDPQRRPTHLFSKPVPIQVILPQQDDRSGETGAQRSGNFSVDSTTPASVNLSVDSATRGSMRLATAPVQFRYQNVWHHVTTACGPERLESGWWRGPSIRRDYYRIETDQGSQWWLYRDLNNGQWHLHGLFD